MLPAEIIRKKRDGTALAPDEITEFITAYVAGEIPDYQVSALLMAIFFRGMSPDETAALTRSMINSGHTYALHCDRPIIDKHSTGGVGDKVSIVLAPLAAACGLAVPMVSGRGLGHTGGTLDKLESIPGFNIHLSQKEFTDQVENLGVAMIGQSNDFVPADKKLYALRDVTATVESIPLICASILSKKIASGAEGIVMDVKCGTGAFMRDMESARDLAQNLAAIAKALDLPLRAVLTDMNQPLGNAVGNALEIRESIECLRGGGPGDLREITVELVAEMMLLGKLASDLEAARKNTVSHLDDGSALEVLRQMIERQGGDPAVIDNPDMLPGDCEKSEYTATRDGFYTVTDCRAIGLAALALGAGRRTISDNIDPAVGLIMHCRIGDKVSAGDLLITIHYRELMKLNECRAYLDSAISIIDEALPRRPLIMKNFHNSTA